ncbi:MULTISPECIES: leucyl aminopeptidase [Moraxella]|uniref:Probable cytosol aminopeptidase n=1 Tax=Moraxella nasicaprae TaxID=2904122 RepID=A0ABY6F6K6_9GAMM|nr:MULTISPECIES: leucyl aminopeptidase [Moraxella]MDO4894812.1 leucyl aminopeptidase [Moraxella sp.]UXZ05726.1 leucyl aminopeptidase [Moraxella nasicaprae]
MPTSNIALAVQAKLTLKKASKTNPLPLIVLFATDKGEILGNLEHAEYIDRAGALIKQANFKGGLGETVTDYALHATDFPAVTIIGTGSLNKLADNIAKVAKATYQAIKNNKSAAILWGDTICQRHFTQFVIALLDGAYRFERHKAKPKDADAITNITIISNKDEQQDYDAALAFAIATDSGIVQAKDVANEAPNILTPSQLAKAAKQLGKDFADSIDVTVLGEKDMEKLGMGCFLSVSQGSDQEGKLAVIEYYGKSGKGKKAKLDNPIALVGKGLTFDSGGISIKPSAGMEEMKFDMGGAAAVLGAMRAAATAGLELDIVAVLACAENMPSGSSVRPSDIVTAMNGLTVEVLNTDAEGRLVLCDALCYVQENYTPKAIIDVATLTGACVVALGSHRSGLYSNDEDTLFALENAGEFINDLAWHMPLDAAYDELINSNIADIQNIGGPKGGSITAACFLQRFIKEGQAWAHLDIAGTAWISGKDKTSTGRPVALLTQYLRSQAK